MLLEEAREAVARACLRLAREGMVVGTAGNVSVRVGDLVAVSPSGVGYDVLAAEHVGVHDLAGEPVEAPLAPSSELPLHLAVYAERDARAVVHTHAPASTALGLVADVVPTSHYYSALFGGAVRVAPYATFGSPRLAANVVGALRGRSAALMANHGAVVLGGTPEQALTRAAYLEYVCDVQLRALSTGLPVRTLPAEEIARVGELLASYGQTPPPRDVDARGARRHGRAP
ncbi:MAG TPA: class II aldolase/adducin family protein [Pseudonocardia sp.]|nr:class II aldolase/adducin family protein [Pseudonocardia sp.]